VTNRKPFWETKNLGELNQTEWESLCDGCGQCCLIRFEDSETGAVGTTSVVCRLFEVESCRCSRYSERHHLVQDCVRLDPDSVSDFSWLPKTCAYRLLDEGRPLYEWHPLLAGNRDEIRRSGVSVYGNVVSEKNVHPDDLAWQIVKWV
jgi:hypothetical protein